MIQANSMCILILDAVMTLALAAMFFTLVAIVMAAPLKALFKLNYNIFEFIQYHLVYMLFFGYIAGTLFLDFYFVGFNDTSIIPTKCPIIYQFHQHYPYNEEHLEFVIEVQRAMDYCS